MMATSNSRMSPLNVWVKLSGACVNKFASVHASVHNHFSQERHLVSKDRYRERRSAALGQWRAVMGLG